MKKIFLSLLLSISVVFLPVSLNSSQNTPLAPITDSSVYSYLESSVIILDSTQQGCRYFGSGTVVGQSNGYAYVLSCAHLFDAGSKRKNYAIGIYYKNGTKLAKSLRYDGELIGVNHPEDLSFLRFKIDEKISFSRIASADYKYVAETKVISEGCDQAVLYIAAYKSQISGLKDINMGKFKCQKCGGLHEYVKSLVLTENGARSGRSGGGLVTLDKKVIGVLSRSSDIENGTGNAMYVSVSDIHAYARKLGLDFLLEEPSELWKNAIVHTEKGDVPAKDYLPMP